MTGEPEQMGPGQYAGRIKEFAMKAGADVVGIAPVERWDKDVPEGHRPVDVLPGAQSVIVVGARGPTAGAWQSPNHRFMEVNGYDFRNDRVIHMVADHIESLNLTTMPSRRRRFPSAAIHPVMSMMHAAVLAGLGTRSLAANIILNPEVRPAVLFRLCHHPGAAGR